MGLFARTYGLHFSLFLAGVVSGATHCTAMCGPFIMAQTGHMTKLRDAALLPYHMGRISTYVVMAILFSSVLNLAFLFLPVRPMVIAPLLMLSGVLFLISAFPTLSSLFPWAARLGALVPYKWVAAISGGLKADSGVAKRFAMGMLLGFMPCGMTVSALMASATAPNAFSAAMAMASFGLGTIPALVLVAIGGQALKVKFPRAMMYAPRGFMAISALWLFVMAGMMLI